MIRKKDFLKSEQQKNVFIYLFFKLSPAQDYSDAFQTKVTHRVRIIYRKRNSKRFDYDAIFLASGLYLPFGVPSLPAGEHTDWGDRRGKEAFLIEGSLS